MKNQRNDLLERCLSWLFSERRGQRKAEELKQIKCPLCGSTEHDSWRTGGCAVFIGHGIFGSKDNLTPVEDAIDKDVSV